MKKLKIILLFSYILIGIYSLFIITNIKYKESNVKVIGTITEIKKKDKYNIIYVKNYIINTTQNFKLGDKIEVVGKRSIIPNNTNFYLFNYNKYLKSKKIYYKIEKPKIKLIKKCSGIYKIKNTIINRIEKMNKKEYYYLFIYGENYLDEDIYNNYSQLGIIHLFALSGMHISFLINIIKKILKNKYIIISIILFYLLLVKPSPSIARAGLMEIIFLLTNKNKKDILIFLFFIFLLYNPFFMYNNGFILSFLVTYTILLIKPKSILKTSFICFLITIPILININFEINFLTIIFNIIYIPYITIILFPIIIFTFIFNRLNFISIFFINILEKSSIFFSKIKLCTFTFHYLNIILFILLFIIIIISIKKNKYLFLIFFLLFLNQRYDKNIVLFIDVGQGDSILINNTLIDTGGNINYNLSKNVILPILKSRGIKKIENLILTHGDYDHMGEAINLVENFKVENVIFNCGEYNELEQELIKELDKKKIKYYSCIKQLNIDKYKLQFLNTKGYDNENDNSNVIYLNYNDYKFLFMGDAGVEREKDILEKYNLRDIDFLKVGHHGSNTSSSKYFIDNINPKYSLISVGKNNRYGHPKESVLDTLSNSKIYRTDLDGSIEIKLNKNGYKIRTCPP